VLSAGEFIIGTAATNEFHRFIYDDSGADGLLYFDANGDDTNLRAPRKMARLA
jgi:hypothetical protein